MWIMIYHSAVSHRRHSYSGPTYKVCLIVLLLCVGEQARKMTLCCLERVIAYFGDVTLLWSVVWHKHLFVVTLNCIYTPFSADLYNL